MGPTANRGGALLAAAVLLAACGGGGEDCSLRWQEGAVTTWVHGTESSGGTIAGVGGLLRADFTVRETILQAPPGQGALRGLRVERIVAERKADGSDATERWDSSASTGGAAFEGRAAVLRRLVGTELDVWSGPTGEIESFDRLESSRERAAEGLPPDSPERAFLQGFLQPASLRLLLGTPVRLPGGPVTAAQPWPYMEVRLLPAESAGLPAVLYCMGTGRLASVTEGVARIEVAGDVVLDPPEGAPGIPEPLLPFRNLLRLTKGTFQGFARVETASGRLLDGEHVMELDLVFSPPGDPKDVAFSHRIVARVRRE